MSIFEKVLTFIANLITIVTFVFTLFNWGGVNVIVEPVIPSTRIAMGIIIAFVFFSSYGSAVLLLQQTQKGRSILLPCFVSIFVYVFSYLFLIDKFVIITADLSRSDMIMLAILGNWLVFVFCYTLPIQYPDGVSFKAIFLFENYFLKLREALFAIIYPVYIALMFRLLNGGLL